ncbi:hypothetical protein A0H76_3069, partial [Hepatospora eriocheir]
MKVLSIITLSLVSIEFILCLKNPFKKAKKSLSKTIVPYKAKAKKYKKKLKKCMKANLQSKCMMSGGYPGMQNMMNGGGMGGFNMMNGG